MISPKQYFWGVTTQTLYFTFSGWPRILVHLRTSYRSSPSTFLRHFKRRFGDLFRRHHQRRRRRRRRRCLRVCWSRKCKLLCYRSCYALHGKLGIIAVIVKVSINSFSPVFKTVKIRNTLKCWNKKIMMTLEK